jgi:hypothetical protein
MTTVMQSCTLGLNKHHPTFDSTLFSEKLEYGGATHALQQPRQIQTYSIDPTGHSIDIRRRVV